MGLTLLSISIKYFFLQPLVKGLPRMLNIKLFIMLYPISFKIALTSSFSYIPTCNKQARVITISWKLGSQYSYELGC